MADIDGTEIWRTIPPEEKLELMSQAHAKGIMAASCAILVGGTLAVGLHMPWMLWGSLITAPFVFQFTAGKAWRGLRPRLVLEYLAARAAARRYAFSNKGKDLTVNMIFRGKLTRQFSEEKVQEALEAAIENTKDAAVWIALFGDSVVMMSEDVGGARCQLAQVLNDKIDVESTPGPSGKDYANDKEVFITVRNKKMEEARYKLTSRHAAALIVFEKKIRSQMQALKAEKSLEIPQLDAASGDDNDMQIPSLDEY
ncbi:MAG: hypothetical protein J0M12_05385 [Deltaproteobacteria bacterium]|nr:hypothetical protein [Deltaproteobacteria bacterium]